VRKIFGADIGSRYKTFGADMGSRYKIFGAGMHSRRNSIRRVVFVASQ
jgi:hypothetical protein